MFRRFVCLVPVVYAASPLNDYTLIIPTNLSATAQPPPSSLTNSPKLGYSRSTVDCLGNGQFFPSSDWTRTTVLVANHQQAEFLSNLFRDTNVVVSELFDGNRRADVATIWTSSFLPILDRANLNLYIGKTNLISEAFSKNIFEVLKSGDMYSVSIDLYDHEPVDTIDSAFPLATIQGSKSSGITKILLNDQQNYSHNLEFGTDFVTIQHIYNFFGNVSVSFSDKQTISFQTTFVNDSTVFSLFNDSRVHSLVESSENFSIDLLKRQVMVDGDLVYTASEDEILYLGTNSDDGILASISFGEIFGSLKFFKTISSFDRVISKTETDGITYIWEATPSLSSFSSVLESLRVSLGPHDTLTNFFVQNEFFEYNLSCLVSSSAEATNSRGGTAALALVDRRRLASLSSYFDPIKIFAVSQTSEIFSTCGVEPTGSKLQVVSMNGIIKDANDMRPEYFSCHNRRSTNPRVCRGSDVPQTCSLRETNSFVTSNTYFQIVTKCLTLDGTAETYSDLVNCMVSTIFPSLGMSLLNEGCFDCLATFVNDEINNISDKSVRNTCIADPFASVCLSSIDFSNLIECSNGYDPRYPSLFAYCTENEAKTAISWSVYRTLMSTCVSNYTIVVDSELLSNCVGMVLTNSDLSSIGTDCLGCWNDFLSALVSRNDSTIMSLCVADPTGGECVLGTADLLESFSQCAGFNPVATDFELINDYVSVQDRSGEGKVSSTMIFVLIVLSTLINFLF